MYIYIRAHVCMHVYAYKHISCVYVRAYANLCVYAYAYACPYGLIVLRAARHPGFATCHASALPKGKLAALGDLLAVAPFLGGCLGLGHRSGPTHEQSDITCIHGYNTAMLEFGSSLWSPSIMVPNLQLEVGKA